LFIEEYNKKIHSGQEVLTGKIQKSFSSAQFISLSIRFPGVTRYLFLGRGNHFEGAWLNERNIPGPLRLRDRYLEYIRKYLVGSRIAEIIADEKDRIIYIPYFVRGELNLFSLFWKGRSFYFLNIFTNDKNQKQIYTCWNLLKNNIVDLEKCNAEELVKVANHHWDQLGRGEIELSSKKAAVKNIEQYFESELKKTSRKIFPGRKKKFFQRKISRIEQDLKKVYKWRELSQLIQTEEFKLPDEYSFKLLDIKFKVPVEWNEFKRKNIIFDKIKKFKKAESILNKRLNSCREEFASWCEGDKFEDVGKGKVCVPIWHKTNKKHQKLDVDNENLQIFEYHLSSELKFAVGKTSQSNDYLRIKWASKEDYWFHIDGIKSAHLIIKTDSLNNLSPEAMSIIGSALRDLSVVDMTSIPLVYTQVKNLKGVKGRAGAVTMKKQKYLTVLYEEKWKEIISID